jgi:hypothetical protein
MLQDLLKKLEEEHGIAPSQGSGILNTITQHIKQQFPMVGEMLDKVLGSQATSTENTSNPLNNTVNESSLQQLEDLAKSKLGGMFGGNS